jgi:hypothetical protein
MDYVRLAARKSAFDCGHGSHSQFDALQREQLIHIETENGRHTARDAEEQRRFGWIGIKP